MVKNLVFLITGLSMLFFSCAEKSTKTYHENGKLMEEFFLNKNGEKNGPYTAWYDTGILYETSQYKNGKMTGERKLYYTDGKLEILETYNDEGLLDGPYITYYQNGKVMVEKKYSKNTLQGKVLVYYENGQLKEEVLFKDNAENGPFTEYFPNGKVQWKGTYLNGPNEFGPLEEYDSTGLLIKKMICDSFAICRSTWKIENYDEKYKQ